MKAILEFNLPEDQYEFQKAQEGVKIMGILLDIDQFLRNKIKYDSESLSEETIDELELIRTELRRMCNDLSIKIDE